MPRHPKICKQPDRRKGRFAKGDLVEWRASKNGIVHAGEVVEVVSFGMYPKVTAPGVHHTIITWPELCRAHYCREHESYVVEDYDGKHWWPRVGNLVLKLGARKSPQGF